MHLACLKIFFVEKNITVIEAHSITKEAFENVDDESIQENVFEGYPLF